MNFHSIEEKVDALERFCELFDSGYLKHWKANSMFAEFEQGRYEGLALTNWVHGCLRMEGFTPSACNQIALWFEENLKRD